MKRKLLLFSIIFISVFSYSFLNFKKSIFMVDAMRENKIVICLNNFDNINDEYKEKFLNLNLSLTFKIFDKEIYKNYISKEKMFTNSIIIPKTYMSIVAKGNSLEVRNAIYNSISVSKQQGICVLIMEMDKENEEIMYFALCDSMSLFKTNNIETETFDFILNNNWHNFSIILYSNKRWMWVKL